MSIYIGINDGIRFDGALIGHQWPIQMRLQMIIVVRELLRFILPI